MIDITVDTRSEPAHITITVDENDIVGCRANEDGTVQAYGAPDFGKPPSVFVLLKRRKREVGAISSRLG